MAFMVAFAAILILQHVTFFFAALHKRNDYADVIWGPGFVLASFSAYGWQSSYEADYNLDLRRILALAFVLIWAARLFLHIGIRNLKKDKEDIRYLEWRKAWGKTWFWRSYLQVFILQGMIMMLIATPLIYILSSPPKTPDIFMVVGVMLWVIGFVVEAIADEQLRRFKESAKNKGKIMNKGLWFYSRHPNYFGEVVQWWGIFLLAAILPLGSLTVVSPILITFLILKVSGVPMLEELMSKRAGWAEYKKRTSVFFPCPPRNK